MGAGVGHLQSGVKGSRCWLLFAAGEACPVLKNVTGKYPSHPGRRCEKRGWIVSVDVTRGESEPGLGYSEGQPKSSTFVRRIWVFNRIPSPWSRTVRLFLCADKARLYCSLDSVAVMKVRSPWNTDTTRM